MASHTETHHSTEAIREPIVEGVPLGSYTEVVNDTGGVLCIRYGPNTGVFKFIFDSLTILGWAILPLDPGSGFLISGTGVFANYLLNKYKQDTTITQAIASEAISGALDKGLRRVDAGGAYKSEKLTLSLVHQANVELFMPADDGNATITTYSGSFTVWTGKSLNSVKRYSLASQLGKLERKVLKVQVDNESAVSIVRQPEPVEVEA